MAEVSSKELYEFKKTLKELANKRGRGTELVSVYIPPTKQLSDVGKHMRDEMGQSANIKSKQTRKNVQSAIAVILESIKLYRQPPENGLVLFVGMIPKGGPGTEKMEKYFKSIDCKRINIEVFGPNKKALAFYNKNDYIVRDMIVAKQI